MHRKAIWVWCLILLVGCSQADPQPKLIVNRKPGYVEVKTPTTVSHITANRNFTFSIMKDLEDQHRYQSSIEHDCSERVSILRYLAVYDEASRLINEDKNLEVEVDFEPGSVGEIEFELACLAPALESNNV